MVCGTSGSGKTILVRRILKNFIYCLDIQTSGNRLPQPNYCSDNLYKLLIQCWSRVPQHRPHFNYISHFIDVILDDLSPQVVECGNYTSQRDYITIPLT